MEFLKSWQLRAEFALRLSEMYGEEVPAYTTLVDVSTEVNEDVLREMGEAAERLGTISRVTAERHGAIRVGSPEEMAQVARVFAAFGMHPVGFYDLRDASKSSVPVVSTAFRPIEAEELALNPFRVFTSMLAADDPRFFDTDLQSRLRDFLGERTLFPSELLELADRAAAQDGLALEEAEKLLDLATGAFRLSEEPVEHSWYQELEAVSAVAADIGGVSTTHINHLTPRVLDIDELYRRMEARGITMIDEVQGPPAWDGPDVLLRQTSFRALAEERVFRYEDGRVGPGELKVRFGEVEQRGIALTPQGRQVYDEMVAEVDRRLQNRGGTRADVAREVWAERLPRTEIELALSGLAFFTYRVLSQPRGDSGQYGDTVTLRELLESGRVVADPIVYEDFLPRSAAGIFQSNLSEDGSRDDAMQGTDYDIEVMSSIIGRRVVDPHDLYRAQEDASLTEISEQLEVQVVR
ncbi:2-oxoadipate dioxygenase/decarboxylase [Nesterenkonia aerolata]|uniref:2-oxoadipate dioxygenase/decarboxylase n=1 Tax=Nesterenkonia aerolata TaxID=3074079 RepID=A0ABU2DUC8_9MICC|nr:VOC family protein [Nesterenkonia sp. LY-0111]MDR8020103.1 VOC family protein [Nesterenkonia sp. LY-0111]